MSDVNRNSFDCMINGHRCTKCCEVLHIPKRFAKNIRNKYVTKDDKVALKYWRRVSKRVAKKINPYMFGKHWDKNKKKWLRQDAEFFKCLAFVGGKCTTYKNRPFACTNFSSGGMYQYECALEGWEQEQKKIKEQELRNHKQPYNVNGKSGEF